MYLIEEHVPFHMVKTVFKYSFKKRRYGFLKMSTLHIIKPLNTNKQVIYLKEKSLMIVVFYDCSNKCPYFNNPHPPEKS